MTYTFLPESNIIHIVTLIVLSYIKGCVHLSFEFFLKMICYPHYLLASPKNIGVHNSTPKYASTANISTTPTSPYNYGLAMLPCITPFQNMHPQLVY
jgi:hypothetical protein